MVTVYKERCKGCGYCIEFCPQHALSVSEELNEKGYNPVQLDESRCVSCGICYTVCPDYAFVVERKG